MPRRPNCNPHVCRTAFVVAACLMIALPHAWAAKVKKKPGPNNGGGPDAAAAPAELPADLNMASLRVAAMQTLYELDASPEQMRALRSAASGLADSTERSPAKGSPKVTAALAGLRDALLTTGGEDQKIAEARNALADATAEAEVQLDDTVHPSAGARTKAAAIGRTFSAGQLAAYLAAHADQVVGPGERLVTAVVELRDEGDAEVKQVATEVGLLVGGADAARATAAAGKATNWLRANRTTAVPDTAEGRARLEASARAALGDVPPVEVLGHWIDDEIAQLLANPQFPEAASGLIAAREKDQH